MLRRDRSNRDENMSGNGNIPVKMSGRSTSANGTMEILQKKLSGNSQQCLERFKNMASGILGKNGNDLRDGIQTRRAALADMKNVATNDGNRKISKDGGESSFSLLTSKVRRSFSASPKRTRRKSVDKKQSESGITFRKDLVELAPSITNAGVHYRSRHVLEFNVLPSAKHLKEKPTSNERASQAPTFQSGLICEKSLKPLPFHDGKRSFDNTYNSEVVYCDQYAADNWDYLFYIENKGVVPSNFLHGSRITPRNRMTTIDWITRIQITFKLLPETQLTTVNLFDRCLMARRFTVEKKEIQLIALGCAVVAAKYEEIYPPEISEYLGSCSNTKQEILRAEINVLHLLNFDLRYPRAIQFIRRLTEHYDLSVHTLAKAISEIASYDYNTCHLKPSVIAAVSVFIAAALEEVEFPEKLHRLARVSEAEAQRLATVFASAILELIRNEKIYNAIYKRMCTQRRIVFTNKHIAHLVSLVTKSH